MNDDFVKTNSRRSDPWTSAAAAEGAEAGARTDMQRILVLMAANHPKDWTATEVWQATGIVYQNCGRRMSDMKREGWLEQVSARLSRYDKMSESFRLRTRQDTIDRTGQAVRAGSQGAFPF